MPTPPPVAEVLRVAVGFSIGTDLTARYRFFVQYSGTAPTDAVCAAIAAAVEAYATIGEISDALRRVFGEYTESVVL